MSMRQLWEGADGKDWLKKLNGRTKLLFIFFFRNFDDYCG